MAIVLKKNIVPATKYPIKCPYSMAPTSITVHNTYNDASAANEIKYMISNNNEVSYHIAVDDKEAILGIPLNRNAWAAGDGGRGQGNRSSIHIEICYSKSGGQRYKAAEDRTIKLIAQMLKERGWGVDRVKKHQDWSGKNCPHRILNEGRWSAFKAAIQQELTTLKRPDAKPAATKPKEKAEVDMLQKAIVIGGFPDMTFAEVLAARIKAPIYTRAALPSGKIAKEVYVVGGSVNGLQADKVISLTGKDRFEVSAAVEKFLK